MILQTCVLAPLSAAGLGGAALELGGPPREVVELGVLAAEEGVQVGLVADEAILAQSEALLDRLDHFDPLQLRVVFLGRLSAWTAAGLPEGVLHAVLPPDASPAEILLCLRSLYELAVSGETVRTLEDCLDRYSGDLDEILAIGKRLTAERDLPTLLRLMLGKSMDITGADAGSIFLIEQDGEERRLRFKITDTRSLVRQRRYEEFTMPLTTRSLAGFVALTGESLIIDDVYQLDTGLEYGFDPSYDREQGYRTKSMLVVPLIDHKQRILGVIQLINAKREAQRVATDLRQLEELVIPFTVSHKEFIGAIAGQAAVSIENNQLYRDIERLFEGFVEASVTAIESRDPTTSGHSFRVAQLTVELARCVDQASVGRYADVRLSDEHLKEIRYASLLHDFGKVGVREEVLTKPKKLLDWQLAELVHRFEWLRKDTELRNLRERLKRLEAGQPVGDDPGLPEELARLEEWLQLVRQANEPSLLPAEAPARLREIHEFHFVDAAGRRRPLLDQSELGILMIPRGSLTPEEWRDMQSHVVHTYEFLRRIPWTSELSRVPEIAHAHHEKLDGSGYPRGLGADEIPLGGRLMAVTDIYDALTAADRPYKRAVSHEKALDILHAEAREGKLDTVLLEIFVQRRVHRAIQTGS
jgi:HD-GYP domain-containing protein (c-di-GMP phosphodiesterase class II)